MLPKYPPRNICIFAAIFFTDDGFVVYKGGKCTLESAPAAGNWVINMREKLISDGVLVSTPAGSTAYNLSVHGPILSLNSKKLSIAPISPFRPRRWRGKVVSEKSRIIIKNLNPAKRPISAVADNIEVRNAKTISIKTNNKIKFNLLYDRNKSLQKKIKIEQLRKEIS